MRKQDLKRVSEYVWEVPKSFQDGMRVPARLYSSERMLDLALRDRSGIQLANTATLPGVVKYTLAMPDMHQGYGFPIGGVAATEAPDGVISPGGVGYDINCGVRLLSTKILREEIEPYLEDLTTALYHNCPSGVGEKGHLRLSQKELDQLAVEGSKWALKKGYARREDLERTEESGQLAGADPSQVSQRAKQRGMPQVGTLGAGNHFIEIDVIDKVYDEKAAGVMGLSLGGIALQIHCGSRGFGHQVCDDYVKRLQPAVHKYGIQLPDRQLVCAPFESPEGQAYYGAMACAANYAFANRQVLLHYARQSFEQILAGKVADWDLYQVYDIAHNMAKFETHEVDGQRKRLCIHRKGATRAFGPGQPGVPAVYQEIGQPVLVPGSMGTASYVLVGTQESMEQTFGSTCHGAGRTMSRAEAKRRIHGGKLKDQLERQGIVIRAGSLKGLAEEAPDAYKEVDNVVAVVHGAGIARKVARLRPLAVIKGSANSLLQSDVIFDESTRQYFLQSIDKDADTLTRLVDDLLMMSRLEAEALEVKRKLCKLSEVIETIQDRLDNLTVKHQLQVNIPDDLPPVNIDDIRIGQVLTNLVENAVKFSDDNTNIRIEAESNDKDIIVSVTDQGSGIPPEIHEKIFERFFQGNGSKAGRRKGTGLGLAICRGIIEAHGGKIWVESQPDQGARFTFSLPLN